MNTKTSRFTWKITKIKSPCLHKKSIDLITWYSTKMKISRHCKEKNYKFILRWVSTKIMSLKFNKMSSCLINSTNRFKTSSAKIKIYKTSVEVLNRRVNSYKLNCIHKVKKRKRSATSLVVKLNSVNNLKISIIALKVN